MHQKPEFFIKIMLALLFFIPNTAYCKYSGPMRFSWFLPCGGNASFCYPRILAEGIIEPDTAKIFREFLGSEGGYGASVCFDSPGGDLKGAITLGETIREQDLSTCLKSEYTRVSKYTREGYEDFCKNAICASSCVFAFAGGVDREVIGKRVSVGVHQFFGASKPIGDSTTQLTIVALAVYLEKMGVSRNLLDIASLFPPDKLYWLSQKEIRQLKLDNMSIELSEWKLDTTEDGSVFAHVIQNKPRNHSQVGLSIIKINGLPRLTIYFVPLNPTTERLKKTKKVLNSYRYSNKFIHLIIDDKEIANYEGPNWQNFGDKALATSFMLSKQTVQHLRSGKKLEISFWVANVDREYDPSLEFQLDGLSHLMSAVLK